MIDVPALVFSLFVKDVRVEKYAPLFFLPVERIATKMQIRTVFFLFAPAVLMWMIARDCFVCVWMDLMSFSELIRYKRSNRPKRSSPNERS